MSRSRQTCFRRAQRSLGCLFLDLLVNGGEILRLKLLLLLSVLWLSLEPFIKAGCQIVGPRSLGVVLSGGGVAKADFAFEFVSLLLVLEMEGAGTGRKAEALVTILLLNFFFFLLLCCFGLVKDETEEGEKDIGLRGVEGVDGNEEEEEDEVEEGELKEDDEEPKFIEVPACLLSVFCIASGR